MCDAFGRCVGAMGGGEGIVDENIAEAREDFRKRRIVRFLAGMEAGVLHEQAPGRASPRAPRLRPCRHASR